MLLHLFRFLDKIQLNAWKKMDSLDFILKAVGITQSHLSSKATGLGWFPELLLWLT